MNPRRFVIIAVLLVVVVALTAGCSARTARLISRERASIEADKAQDAREAARAEQLEAERPRREAAVAASLETLGQYVGARNKALAHPGERAHDEVATTAVAEALDDHRAEVGAMSSRGVHQVGSARVEAAVASLVDLEGFLDHPPRVILDVCLDRQGVHRVDGAGRQLALLDDARYSGLRVEIHNTDPPSTDGWRVAAVETTDTLIAEAGTCLLS